jgi:hypothetical protein
MTIPEWLPPTRFRALPRRAALAVLAGLLLLIGAGIAGGVAHDRAHRGPPGHGDLELYLRVIDDVAKGQPYYAAVVAEQRTRHYPLKPAFTVRNPLLTVAMAALPNDAARTLSLRILAILVLAAWGLRLHLLFGRTAVVGAGMVLLACGLVAAMLGGLYAFHDIWAGALIALSLAARGERRWLASVLIGFLAVVLRDLSLLYLLAMGAVALVEGKRREALAWAVAIMAFLAVLGVHAHFVAEQLRPGDHRSPGWLAFGGWPFVLANAKFNALLVLDPPWVIATAVPLMLLGLAAWPGPLGARLAVICLAYNLLFLFFGRPDNSYWGVIITPLMALGPLMAPRGLFELARACRIPRLR